MPKHRSLWLVLTAGFILAAGSCATTSSGGDLPNSLFGVNPMEWAELRISGDNIYVQSINGHMLNWGPGTKPAVPAGVHTIVAGRRGTRETISMVCEFLPGHSYMIEYRLESISEETRGIERIRTYRGSIIFREYGVTPMPVPGRNESIVEFTLTGLYTWVMVNGYSYRLSNNERDSAEKLLLVLPPGSHRIVSTAGTVDFELGPNRFVSYDINTNGNRVDQTRNDPFGFLGKWRFSLDSTSYIDLTFSLEGRGYVEAYQNNVLLTSQSGYFSYTATDSIITTRGVDSTMRYRVEQNSNILTLENFLNNPVTLTGTRQ